MEKCCFYCSRREYRSWCPVYERATFDWEVCPSYENHKVKMSSKELMANMVLIAIALILFYAVSLMSGCSAEEPVNAQVQELMQVSDIQYQAEQVQAEAEPMVEEQDEEPEFYEPEYYEPAPFDIPSGVLTMQGGVNGYNGKTETWYSSNVAPHKDMDAWTLREDGVWTDADGYVIIASSDMPFGTEHETSLGMGKVYDTGCASGVVDVYVAW